MAAPRLLVLLLMALLLGLPAGSSGALAAPSIESAPHTIPSWDGTSLSATLHWSAVAVEQPAPAILMTHGWAGSKEDLVDEARWLADLGYVVLTYDSRGFGASGGMVGLNGPNEQADVRHLVTWLAERPENEAPKVLLDDPQRADPRIGMFGYSYGGAIQLLAAAGDDRIDALVPDITWNHLEESLAPGTVVKRGWVDLLFWGGMFGAHGSGQGAPGERMDPRLQQWYLEAAQTGRFPPDARSALLERSPAGVLANVTADVFLAQGLRDTLFVPDEALRSHAVLRDRDAGITRLLIHGGGHGHTLDGPGETHLRAAVAAFYGETLNGDLPDDPPPVSWFDAAGGTWQTSATWPPADITVQQVSLVRPMDTTTLAQGAVPASHTETQELEGTLGPTTEDAPLPTATLLPVDIEAPATLLGAATVNVTVRPDVSDLTLFFALVDQAPDGTERVVGNQVTPVRIEDASGQEVVLELPLVSVAHNLQNGHTLLLRVATSDSGYHGGREVGLVALETGTLTLALPVAETSDVIPLDGAAEEAEPDAADVPGPALPLLLMGLLLVLGRRPPTRRTRSRRGGS